ncbi:MAG: DRTGG domain-containing protein [Nitrospiraceae bacterium]|nr:DRTGG domain-containing protein [Nitrospiraceae bacterium]
MTLQELAKGLDVEVLTGDAKLEREIAGGYVSDLLSDVIGNAKEGFVWITFQVHMNIVAAASLKGLAGIILVNGRRPPQDTLQKASEENVIIMTTPLPAFEVVGRLYELGLRCR